MAVEIVWEVVQEKWPNIVVISRLVSAAVNFRVWGYPYPTFREKVLQKFNPSPTITIYLEEMQHNRQSYDCIFRLSPRDVRCQ